MCIVILYFSYPNSKAIVFAQHCSVNRGHTVHLYLHVLIVFLVILYMYMFVSMCTIGVFMVAMLLKYLLRNHTLLK